MSLNFYDKMKYFINHYVCVLIYILFLSFYYKKNEVDFAHRIDYEIEIFKDTCYLNLVTLIYENSTDNFLFKGTVTNFSRDYILNLIDLSNISRVKYS